MSETNLITQGGLRTRGNFKQGTKLLPLVSIITVVFNGESELESTIKSVINQSYNNIEYIIIDGNSQDKTLGIIKQYESQIDYWMSETDVGIYDAMNKGIKLAKGKIIGLINCGDTYLENGISEIVNIYHDNFESAKFLVITGAMLRFDVEKNYRFKIEKNQELIAKKINRGMPINHPATFITKDTYDEFGIFDTQYYICGDYDLIFRLYNSSLVKFVVTEKVIANMQLGGVSEQFSSIWIRCQEHFKIRKANLLIFHNLWLCASFFIITATKFILKLIVRESLMSFYYKLRHN